MKLGATILESTAKDHEKHMGLVELYYNIQPQRRPARGGKGERVETKDEIYSQHSLLISCDPLGKPVHTQTSVSSHVLGNDHPFKHRVSIEIKAICHNSTK